MTKSSLPLLVAAVAATLTGAWTMYQEAQPNLRGGNTAVTRLAGLPETGAAVGLSTLTQRQALLDCELVLRSNRAIALQYVDAEQRDRLPAICLGIADQITAASPANALAWLVGAVGEIAAGDAAEFNARLMKSYLTSPRELWLARMRTRIAEAHHGSLLPDLVPHHDADIMLVAASPGHNTDLALKYLRDGSFRTRMSTLLETMAPAGQQSFLHAVRGILAASGR